jgi:hypothetical protein
MAKSRPGDPALARANSKGHGVDVLLRAAADALPSVERNIRKLRKNRYTCLSERGEESRSALFSGHCKIPRRLRPLGMTGQEGFSSASEPLTTDNGLVAKRDKGVFHGKHFAS